MEYMGYEEIKMKMLLAPDVNITTKEAILRFDEMDAFEAARACEWMFDLFKAKLTEHGMGI